jgi:hypothetical protein
MANQVVNPNHHLPSPAPTSHMPAECRIIGQVKHSIDGERQRFGTRNPLRRIAQYWHAGKHRKVGKHRKLECLDVEPVLNLYNRELLVADWKGGWQRV